SKRPAGAFRRRRGCPKKQFYFYWFSDGIRTGLLWHSVTFSWCCKALFDRMVYLPVHQHRLFVLRVVLLPSPLRKGPGWECCAFQEETHFGFCVLLRSRSLWACRCPSEPGRNVLY